MTPEELDKATADEAWRLLEEGQDVAVIAARMAREGWKPPEPVDPDVELAMAIARGKHSELADVRAVEATAASVLAGIKAGREQEQERAKVLVEYASAMVSGFFLLSDYRERASAALAAYKAGKAAR
jgi:hypothetical protein